MHELAVTEGLLEIAVRHAAANKAQRVTDLHIVIGQLASIVDDSVQFYWDIISAGTTCEGAHLTFERIPATLTCAACNLTFAFDPNSLTCPTCGSADAKLITGEEFRLDSIEIEKAEPEPISP
jgi:hydrogenase nickel incorporation protein HypA/HybF